jgi:hypothetical protein
MKHWWFGGGTDLTPYFLDEEVINSTFYMIIGLAGGMAEWSTCHTDNLRIAGHVGSNPTRSKLFLHSLVGHVWFQEQIRECVYKFNQTSNQKQTVKSLVRCKFASLLSGGNDAFHKGCITSPG